MQYSLKLIGILLCSVHGLQSVNPGIGPGIMRRSEHDLSTDSDQHSLADSDRRSVFMTGTGRLRAQGEISSRTKKATGDDYDSVVELMGSNATQLTSSNATSNATVATPAGAASGTTAAPTVTAAPCEAGWTCGTYISSFWDCCEPTCAAPGKGNVTGPVSACDAVGFKVVETQPPPVNVCDAGSTAQNSNLMLAGACPSFQPWESGSNTRFSYGFAKVRGGSADLLSGDANCGQCYELKFAAGQSVMDPATGEASGGAHPELLTGDKRLIVQVISVESGSGGANSFQIFIPGGGLQTTVDDVGGGSGSGCGRFYNDAEANHFDCGQRFTGCNSRQSCIPPFPEALRTGCEWKFDWMKWLADADTTNNPYVDFKRVRCPKVITVKSRTEPADDDRVEVASWTQDDYLAGYITDDNTTFNHAKTQAGSDNVIIR